MTIECKDLEWEKLDDGSYRAHGIGRIYFVVKNGNGWLASYQIDFGFLYGINDRPDELPIAQAAANEHNKQQFQQIIEQWRKG